MRRPQERFLAALAYGIAVSAMAGTQYISIPTRVGNGADALVRKIDPTSNFGSADQIPLWSYSLNNWADKVYLRFDLTAGGIADPAQISAAKLEITLRDVTIGATTKTINVFALHENDDTWNEINPGGITWNNAPANNTNHNVNMLTGSNPGQCQSLGSFQTQTLNDRNPLYPPFPKGYSYTFSTANVNSHLKTDTDGVVSFALTSNETPHNHIFVSKEYAASRPYDPPPTLALEVDEPSHENVTLNAEANYSIKNGSPDESSASVQLKYTLGIDTYKSYIRFDLPAAGIAKPSRISSARFTIRLYQVTGSAQPKQIRVFGLHEAYDWTTGALTWNNAPANSSGLRDAIDTGKGVLLGTFTVPDNVSGGGYYYCTFDSDRLPGFLEQETDGILTLVLAAGTYTPTGEHHIFYTTTTDGGSSPPKLTVSLFPLAGTLIMLR